MADHPASLDLVLEPEDNERLRNVCGQLDEHLRLVETRLGIEINNRGNNFRLLGEPAAVAAGRDVLQGLYAATADEALSPASVHLYLRESGVDERLAAGAGPGGRDGVRGLHQHGVDALGRLALVVGGNRVDNFRRLVIFFSQL